MPSRLLREGIISSDRIEELDWAAEVFYRRLMSKVDDFGLFDARLHILRTSLYPTRVDRVREADIARWIAMCEKAGVIALYQDGGKPYGQMLDTGWQTRSEPKHPLPPWGKCSYPGTPANSCKQLGTVAPLFGDGDGDGKEQGGPPTGDPPKSDPIPYQAIADLHNELMQKLPKVRELTGKRRTLIRSGWQASPQRHSLAFWRCLFEEYADDPFTNGTGPYRPPHANWRPDFDYLLRPEVITKIYERALDRLERTEKAA